jgi:hypothetical protein
MIGQSPFAKRPDKDPNLGRRRSSRIEFIAPVIVTGRDASGQPFREETETRTVNFHGAKIATRHTVLVGMQVSLECPRTGKEGKAVCVHIEATEADASIFEMAVQLIVPTNLWGVENPPEDWGFKSPAGAGQREAPGRSSGLFFAGVRTAGSKEDSDFVPSTSTSPAPATPLASFEKRVAGVVERALADFESRLKTLEAESAARLEQHSAQAMEQLETLTRHSEKRLNADIESSREELAAAVDETIRSKVGEMFKAVRNPLAAPQPDDPSPRPLGGPKKL